MAVTAGHAAAATLPGAGPSTRSRRALPRSRALPAIGGLGAAWTAAAWRSLVYVLYWGLRAPSFCRDVGFIRG
jgi:hypothetical protein